MTEKRFKMKYSFDDEEYVYFDGDVVLTPSQVLKMLNEQQEQLDLYKEAILTMLGLLADKGIIFSGVKDE